MIMTVLEHSGLAMERMKGCDNVTMHDEQLYFKRQGK